MTYKQTFFNSFLSCDVSAVITYTDMYIQRSTTEGQPANICSVCTRGRFRFLFLVTLVQQISNKKDSQYLQQTQKYPQKSNLKSSYPFLDYNGILTVGGRLQQSSLPSLPYLIIHQLISPVTHHFQTQCVCNTYEIESCCGSRW